jgi:hypothetical protein
MKRQKLDDDSSTQEVLDRIDAGTWGRIGDVCLNLGVIGPAGIPKVEFRRCAKDMFPMKNGHNTFYYKFKDLVNEDVSKWVDEIVLKLSTQLKVEPEGIMPKSNKCGKCNCKFHGVDGRILRIPVLLRCGCKEWKTVTSCLKCKVIQWLFEGSLQSKLYGVETLNTAPQTHPGHSVCFSCDKNYTLRNLSKV